MISDCYTAFQLPSEIRGLAALILMFGQGSFSDLGDLGFVIDDSLPASLLAVCPDIDIDFDKGAFSTTESLPASLDIGLTEALLAAKRVGEREGMSDQERCFGRLSSIAASLIETGDPKRGISLLRLTSQVLSQDKQSQTAALVAPLSEPYGLNRQDQPSPQSTVPLLRAKLFGGLEIELDGKVLPRSTIHKGLARTLFCFLILNQGKGLYRETVIEWLWPMRDEKKALTGFYNLWSRLCNSLPSYKGNCLYFSNDEQLLRINPRFVESDIADFDRLSRTVIFSQGSLEERFAAIDRLEQLYSNDVLAGSVGHPRISAAQERYRGILVDVLLSASSLHLDEGNKTMALWYAKRALDTDPKREDTYRALMHTQEACGQRTEAMNTYHECRKFLDDELGILPSQQTTALYQNLIIDGQ
ncbi:MAG: bacterial transcriptional activator domain-containing protein [Coriobacteriia bacterium]|nr:bacterial transcriptional activator domain-containing protein [Coriobacteriia bacterium]